MSPKSVVVNIAAGGKEAEAKDEPEKPLMSLSGSIYTMAAAGVPDAGKSAICAFILQCIAFHFMLKEHNMNWTNRTTLEWSSMCIAKLMAMQLIGLYLTAPVTNAVGLMVYRRNIGKFYGLLQTLTIAATIWTTVAILSNKTDELSIIMSMVAICFVSRFDGFTSSNPFLKRNFSGDFQKVYPSEGTAAGGCAGVLGGLGFIVMIAVLQYTVMLEWDDTTTGVGVLFGWSGITIVGPQFVASVISALTEPFCPEESKKKREGDKSDDEDSDL